MNTARVSPATHVECAAAAALWIQAIGAGAEPERRCRAALHLGCGELTAVPCGS
jgi:hypothetical protein